MQPGSTNQQNLTQLPEIKEAYPLIQTELFSSQEWTYIWIGLALVLALCLFYGIYKWIKRPQAEVSLTPYRMCMEKARNSRRPINPRKPQGILSNTLSSPACIH